MRSIEESPATPIRKVRLLARLRRRLKLNHRLVSEVADRSAHTNDRTSAAALARMSFNLEVMADDVRDAAYRVMKSA